MVPRVLQAARMNFQGRVPDHRRFEVCRVHANIIAVEGGLLTAEPSIATAPRLASNGPLSTPFAPTAADREPPLTIEALVRFSNPTGSLSGPFEAPNLITPVDKSDPFKVVGNGCVAQLSPTLSTIFVFDIRPEHEGKTCNLEFHMPPISPWPDMSAVKVRSPGGIAVTSVGQKAASTNASANATAAHIRPAVIASAACWGVDALLP